MYLRNQEKAVRMSNSCSYNYNLPNLESSAKPPSTIPERGREERPGNEDNSDPIFNPPPAPDHPPEHQNLPPHRRRVDGHKPRRDPDPADADADVGPIPISSRSNSNLNRPDPSASATPTDTATATAISGASTVHYRECRRNHAAHLGGHVMDGCGEFMPGGEDGTPDFFKCAACSCHRNFHRKETDSGTMRSPPPPPPPPSTNCYITYNPAKAINQKHITPISAAAQPAPPLLHSPQPQIPQQRQRVVPLPHQPSMMAFGGGGTGAVAESSSEDLNIFQSEGRPSETFGASKKRFRTKFTQEQKDRMIQFGEKIGWRIQKQDEREVQQFCDEVGVKRRVFKVWMHNNKQAMKRKQI